MNATHKAEAVDVVALVHELGARARAASFLLSIATPEEKNRALGKAAEMLRARANDILTANAKDVEIAKQKGMSDAMIDRLVLNAQRIEAMAKGVEVVMALPDPVGRVLEAWDVASNGLHIEKISVPLGVIGIIYESRPNVTVDAAALCLKSGNAVILRGGSDSFHSSSLLVALFQEAIIAAQVSFPAEVVQAIPTADREAVGAMLSAVGAIDIIVPRGGKSLTERVAQESRIPTILHLDGNCHSYIHRSADAAKALRVVVNAKLRRTGVCGATESLVIDEAVLGSHLPAIADALIAQGCELRGDAKARAVDTRIIEASEEDWRTEYLDKIISIKTVAGIDDAIAHINHYGSHHTDAIIAEDVASQQRFAAKVDSAIVAINASTQFADGGEFGFGAEIGISTGRLHARGPVGAAQLTTYKYVVAGSGQPEGAIRP